MCFHELWVRVVTCKDVANEQVEFGSGWFNQVVDQNGFDLKLGHFKQVKTGSSQSGYKSGRVYPYFSHDYLFKIIKRNQHVFAIWKVTQQIT